MGRGVQGVILKAMRATDFTFTVTSTEAVTEHYLRLGFTGGGITAAHPVHPTQWVRLWIPTADGGDQQRGYTLVDVDPGADAFHIEFALHDGPAADWARRATPGDTVDATVLGSNFTLPEPAPSRYLVFGDPASLPAINSLLDAIGPTPAEVWLEWQHADDQQLPVRSGPATEVTWLQRVDEGRLLREAADSAEVPDGAFAWVACDARTTRAVVKSLRSSGLPRTSLKAQAYWR